MVGPRSAKAKEPWTTARWGTNARRSIGRTESSDFRHFPPSQIIISPGPDMLPSETLYTNCRTTVPGAPDHHLMFPAIYRISDDTTTIAFAASHDGKDWHFVPGSPVLDTAAFGRWDGGYLFSHPNLIELPDRSFALPYTGYVYPHKYPRGAWQFLPGYGTWPDGRLVALEAPEEGRFMTVGFFPPTRHLTLNVRTKRAGSVRVEVADCARGNALPGRSFAEMTPIVGDHGSVPVAWGGNRDLGAREGDAIMLRFRMDKAELYGLDFA